MHVKSTEKENPFSNKASSSETESDSDNDSINTAKWVDGNSIDNN